jgi:hypothetical protein
MESVNMPVTQRQEKIVSTVVQIAAKIARYELVEMAPLMKTVSSVTMVMTMAMARINVAKDVGCLGAVTEYWIQTTTKNVKHRSIVRMQPEEEHSVTERNATA